MTFSFRSHLSRLLACAIALLAGFLIERLWRYAHYEMLEAYNAFCAPGNRFLEWGELNNSFTSVLSFVVVAALPVLLSRSKVVLRVNLGLLLLLLAGAAFLPFTARTSPYQCATMGGSYEDHVSGIPEFDLFFLLFLFVSCVLLLLDWGIWGVVSLKRAYHWLDATTAPNNER